MMGLDDFKDVALKYKVIFFDAYGVLKNYKGMLPGVKEMFQFLQENDIAFYILTNDASRSPELLAKSYINAGIDQVTERKIISSGMLAREYIQNKVQKGRIAYLGTDASAHYIENEGLKTISIKDVDLENYIDISALVLLDDEGFDWNVDLIKALNLIRKKPIPVIVANTDGTYPVTRKDVAISVGAVGDMLEALARKTFIRFGKPDSQMFSFAFDYCAREHEVTKNDILMVGDSLITDIIGGNKFGIDTCLVLTGNIQPDSYELMIRSYGIIPDYICESIAL
ncbi:MAG: family HAD-type hydrolase [Bacteroidetes bacterium]|jgi:HAD superfamily hydrolase (TIGR01450 family)|nr:family HAD-type hydrolase [Bacteroidota bacterium]